MLPIVFATLYNNVFDGVYYTLSAISIAFLAYSSYVSLRKRAKASDGTLRNQAIGIGLASIGSAIIIFSGVSLNDLSNSTVISEVLYQRLHFLIFYASVAMILFGIDATLTTAKQTLANSISRMVKPLRIAQGGAFILTVILAVFYLFTASLNSEGRLAQQPVFFLPLIFVVLLGVFELPILAFTVRGKFRKPLGWFGASMVLLFIGALREANIISSGEPLTDLLIAFVPISIASFSFYMSARSL